MNDTVPQLIDALTERTVTPQERDVVRLLTCTDAETAHLFSAANQVRQRNVGDEVYLRGIIEFSNYCMRNCDYCGIRGQNTAIHRYRMTDDEIVTQSVAAGKAGCTTVVLQSGEDARFTADRLCALLRRIRTEAAVAITLSVGERPYEELRQFKDAGADRYLLRFETSNRELFHRLHPDDDYDQRLQCLRDIVRAGMQTGSGFLIGLPGVDLDILARDILFTTALDLDMIGCGPFISHPDTPLQNQPLLEDRAIYFRTIAILRLLNPRAHIPATTAFDALQPDGRDLLLTRGANVFMPNVTPAEYRRHYQLYPGKPCVDEDALHCLRCVSGRLARLKRPLGKGPGHSLKPTHTTGPQTGTEHV